MRTSTILFLLSIATLICLLSSCSSMIECDQVEKRHAFILMDLSDKELFKEIESDLKGNFPGFMQRTSLGNISPCEQFSLSFAHFGGQETLDISTQSISITRKGLSGEEERRLANPKPLVELMREKTVEYNALTDDTVVTSSTSVANILLKAIIQADVDAENYFLILSDGVEYNEHLSLYDSIPGSEKVSTLYKEIIEPSVIGEFRQRQQQGLQAKIIMVLKSEPKGNVSRRKIKAFWISVFKELELEYQFIDNLSNKVIL
ncbi:MAG: hypothetical protein WD048_15890 [Chitinophagales bacterium]